MTPLECLEDGLPASPPACLPTCIDMCSFPASTFSTLSASHFFSNSAVARLRAALSSALSFNSSSPMNNADAEDEGGGCGQATRQELPLEGAADMATPIAGVFDNAKRLRSSGEKSDQERLREAES